MKRTYYKLKMEVRKNGEEFVTIKKIERSEERIDSGKCYIVDGNGEHYRFEKEEVAIDWLNTYVKYEHIDPEYRMPNQVNLLNDCGNKVTNGEAMSDGKLQEKEKSHYYIAN